MSDDFFKGKSVEELQAAIKAARRLEVIHEARESLIRFAHLMRPDPEDVDDANLSMYTPMPHHHLIAEALERVERGECLRLAISIPPQHGKSELASRLFIPWLLGRRSTRNIIFATYNDDFAKEFGGEVRDIIKNPVYKAIFPKMEMKRGSNAKELMVTSKGAKIAFIGRGGSGTGKPANIVIIDDPLKNDEEAQSPTIRRTLHNWFTKVIYARARVNTAIIVIQTRWHEDDLIGRLCDPDHPDYDATLAKQWMHINIPAVVTDPKLAAALGLTLEMPTDPLVIEQFGNKPMAALWPEQFSLLHLATARKQNPRGYDALYSGKPTPDDGEYFKADDLVVHKNPNEYPRAADLYFYGASDHALGEKQTNDKTCMGVFGVDHNDDIWIWPSLQWGRFGPSDTLDRMLALMKSSKPLIWFAEDEHINKTLGPFRRKRMQEEGIYTSFQSFPSAVDLQARARTTQGRTQMRKIHFPGWAPWWQEARAELLRFPYATHDDFVSFLSLIGRGLDTISSANKPVAANEDAGPRPGTIAWIKQMSSAEKRREQMRKSAAGF